jgi:epoxyqueuosine reductase
MTMNEAKLVQGVEFLAEHGLNLFAAIPCAGLPDETRQALLAEDIPLHDHRSLVLIGHGGRRLWPALTAFGMKTADPVDHFSLVMTQRFIDEFLDVPPVLMLYPTGYTIPLQQLGALAGWHYPSPLGLGINETYGVWFAYRAAFLTTLSLPAIQNPRTISPCETCHDKPCINACPVQAVRGVGKFRVPACVDFRLQAQSVCQDRCLSRLACPVTPEHRYEPEQLHYHYSHSLTSIRRYYRQ